MQLLTDVRLKSRSTPATHILYLGIAVSCKRQCIRSSHSEGVCVDPVDGDNASPIVIELLGGPFQVLPHVLVRDVGAHTILPER